jgi:hypothetical protein
MQVTATGTQQHAAVDLLTLYAGFCPLQLLAGLAFGAAYGYAAYTINVRSACA